MWRFYPGLWKIVSDILDIGGYKNGREEVTNTLKLKLNIGKVLFYFSELKTDF